MAGSKPRAVDFVEINQAALTRLDDILRRWLPGGRLEGREYVVRNPMRADQKPGSFKINMQTGRWADWASGDKGGDVISLGAFLFGLRQIEAAQRLAEMLGLSDDE